MNKPLKKLIDGYKSKEPLTPVANPLGWSYDGSVYYVRPVPDDLIPKDMSFEGLVFKRDISRFMDPAVGMVRIDKLGNVISEPEL